MERQLKKSEMRFLTSKYIIEIADEMMARVEQETGRR